MWSFSSHGFHRPAEMPLDRRCSDSHGFRKASAVAEECNHVGSPRTARSDAIAGLNKRSAEVAIASVITVMSHSLGDLDFAFLCPPENWHRCQAGPSMTPTLPRVR